MDHVSASDTLPPIAQALKAFQPGSYRLGELLVGQGTCHENDISLALEVQKTVLRPLGELLVGSGACTRDQIEEALHLQAIARSPFWSQLGHLRWHPDTRTETIASAVVTGVPRYGRFLRLTTSEHAIAVILGTEATYPDLVDRCWERCGVLLTPAQAVELGMRLIDSGLLFDERVGPVAPVARRSWSDLVQWRLPLWDPSRALNWAAPILRWTVTGRCLGGVWLPLVLVAMALALTHGGALVVQVGHAMHPPTWKDLIAYYPWLFGVLALHEFGHAAVCAAFGGPVHQIGLMLYLGMPFGYCDVSSAHLLPSRRERIAVSLGGLYYQTALLALALIAWALPLAGPWHLAATRLITVAWPPVLFDLNPFAKLDGYYVLSDYLEVPNLRERSFAYLRAVVSGGPRETVTSREHWLFLIYGLVGVLITASLLAAGAWWWHGEWAFFLHGGHGPG